MAAKPQSSATKKANAAQPHAGPQIAPPPWQRLPDRPSRRRREPISREAIVTAAIDLLDREGLAALSMRRLAEELGTGAASLYWHVGSKDGLLDLVFDELIGEEQVPDADPSRWQEQLKDIARAQRRVSLRHPYLASTRSRYLRPPHSQTPLLPVAAVVRFYRMAVARTTLL